MKIIKSYYIYNKRSQKVSPKAWSKRQVFHALLQYIDGI